MMWCCTTCRPWYAWNDVALTLWLCSVWLCHMPVYGTELMSCAVANMQDGEQNDVVAALLADEGFAESNVKHSINGYVPWLHTLFFLCIISIIVVCTKTSHCVPCCITSHRAGLRWGCVTICWPVTSLIPCMPCRCLQVLVLQPAKFQSEAGRECTHLLHGAGR